MLFPFLVLSGRWKEMLEEAGDPPMDPAEEERMRGELRLTLADEVIANRHYWFERGIPEPVRRTTPKVGRNDPCPCGSGKKFKNCCGR